MYEEKSLTRSDLGVLFWIVGCRNGAKFDEILEHEGHCHRKPPSSDAIHDSLARLEVRRLIHRAADRYLGDGKLQAAFMNECQNCRDTIEEIDILQRLVTQIDSEEIDDKA